MVSRFRESGKSAPSALLRTSIYCAALAGVFLYLALARHEPLYSIGIFAMFVLYLAIRIYSARRISGIMPRILGQYEPRIAELEARLHKIEAINRLRPKKNRRRNSRMKITGPMSILCVGISSFAIFIVAAEDETPEDECIVGKQFPEGFGVEKSSVSPDGRYGVLVPLDFDHFDENEHENKLVEIKTGRSLAVIDGGTGKAGFLNHSAIAPSRWSSDGSYLLWKVYGKWSPRALVLLKINNGKLQWQRNLLKLMQQEILARTRKADAKSYAAAKKRNAGSAGDYYPEGFTIDVIAEGEAEAPLSLPLNLRAELTSNPKAIEDFPKDAEVNTELEASIDASGKLTVKNFK